MGLHYKPYADVNVEKNHIYSGGEEWVKTPAPYLRKSKIVT